MPYPRFFAANAAGGLCLAGGTTALVYYLGVAAERWLSGFAWIGLVLAVLCGVTVALFLRNRLAAAVAEVQPRHSGDDGPAASIS